MFTLIEAEIKNYGKFNQKTISFQKGINIIYGENEAGKSTLHSFIKSMLFGMEKPRGRASKQDAYSLYEPWENPGFYEGILRFQKDRSTYRIYRRFHKSNKLVSILKEETGEELTETELTELLGMGEAAFQNTISIGQLRVETGREFAEELRNAFANFYSSGTMEWDVTKAYQFLGEQKKKLLKKYDPNLETEVNKAKKELEEIENELMYQSIQREEAQNEIQKTVEKIKRMKDSSEKSRLNKRRAARCFLGSAALFFMTALSYVYKAGYGWICLFGAFTLLLAFISWWGFAHAGKEYDVKDLGEKEKALKNEAQRIDWKLEQMRERSVCFQPLIEGYGQRLTENQKVFEEIEALTLAEETLRQVCGNVQKNCSRQLNSRISELVLAITQGRYENVMLDEQCNLFAVTEHGRLEINKVSRGTMEQFYLALRLAAADLVFGYEQLPLLFDDAFAFYDDKRLGQILKLLAEQRRQILLFTCHRREMELLEKSEIAYCSIYL